MTKQEDKRNSKEILPIRDPAKTIAECLLKGSLVMGYNGSLKALTSTVYGEHGEIFSAILFSDDKAVKTVSKQILSNVGSGITEGGRQAVASLFTYNPAQPQAEEAKISGLIALMRYRSLIREERGEYLYKDNTSAQPAIIKKHAKTGEILHLFLDDYLDRISNNTLSAKERAFLEGDRSFLAVFLEYQRIARNVQVIIPGLRQDIRKDFVRAQQANFIPRLPVISRDTGESSRRPSVFKLEKGLLGLAEVLDGYLTSAYNSAQFLSSYEEGNMNIGELSDELSVAEVAGQLASLYLYTDPLIYYAAGWYLHATIAQFTRGFEQFLGMMETYEPISPVKKKRLQKLLKVY